MAALAVVPSPAVPAAPLYVIEGYLAALVETAELVRPEQEQEFRAELQSVDERAAIVEQVRTAEVKPDKRAIRAAIEGGAHVPGTSEVRGNAPAEHQRNRGSPEYEVADPNRIREFHWTARRRGVRAWTDPRGLAQAI